MPTTTAKETGLLSFDWLDNLLVTDLLDDQTLLQDLPRAATLEIGRIQRASAQGSGGRGEESRRARRAQNQALTV